MSDVLDHHHRQPSIWHDRPPTYERLLVDTLVDIRRNAHKHALLNSSRANVHRQPPSPLTPSSDRLSIHSDGTFDIDLKSIWSQKTIESSLASSSSRSHTPTEQYDPSRPRSPGDESFFPTPVSPTSFFADEEDDDEEEYDDSLDLDLELMAAPDFDEPAPAYDAASASGLASTSTSTSTSTSHVPITRTSPAHTSTSTPTPTPANPSNHLHQQSPLLSTSTRFDPALLAELEDEDPWTAFAALCWARCVYDEPRNPPPHAFGRHTTLARDGPSSSSIDVAETPEPGHEHGLEPEPEPEPESETESAPSLLPVRRSPFPYPSAFSRTEPDLTVGVWKAGDGDGERYGDDGDGDGDGEGGRRDNALAYALGLEDDLSADFDLDYTLDSRPLRPPRTRTPGLAPSQAVVHKLEYVPPRAPSPPRRLHKFNAADLPVFAPSPTPAHAHSRSSSGGGIKRLWPWRAREVLPVQTHAAY